MPRSEKEIDDDDYDSVDEDAELELSCALHDLAEQVKTFQEHMEGHVAIVLGLEGDEICEEIPDMNDDENDGRSKYGQISPERADMKERACRSLSAKSTRAAAKHEYDCDDEEQDDDEDDANDSKASQSLSRRCSVSRVEWDEQNEKQELSELQHNIALLLQGMQQQARDMEAGNNES